MTQPDFIIIPTQLLSDSSLQPSDRILFGYIYWMTKMALMKCVASNTTLSELTGISERAVRSGLERLEQGGYVGRIYQGESNRHRVEIVCLLAFSAVNVAPEEPRRNKRAVQKEQMNRLDGTNVPHNKNTNKTIKKEIVTNVTKELTAPAVYGKPEINELFEYWEAKTGVSIQAKLKQNRYACSSLIKRYGAEGVRRLVDGAVQARGQRYPAPQISDYTELQRDLNRLLSWGKDRMTQTPKVVKI